MLLAPGKGFVFLAVPKTGTTAIERAFRPHSEGSFLRNPFKHSRYDQFQQYVQPFLEAKGFPRESYEVVCISREPLDWLFSWWRYRSRPDLADPAARRHRNYSGDVTFEQFARAYLQRHQQKRTGSGKKYANIGRLSRFVRPLPGEPEVDRIFRYDRMELLVDFLCDKVGEGVDAKARNVSPKRSFELSPECEQDLRDFFQPEYRIHEAAIAEPVAPPRPPVKRSLRSLRQRR